MKFRDVKLLVFLFMNCSLVASHNSHIELRETYNPLSKVSEQEECIEELQAITVVQDNPRLIAKRRNSSLYECHCCLPSYIGYPLTFLGVFSLMISPYLIGLSISSTCIIHNKECYPIYVRCNDQSSLTMILPNHVMKKRLNNPLSKLCVQYNESSSNGVNEPTCLDKHDLKEKLTWYVHDNLTISHNHADSNCQTRDYAYNSTLAANALAPHHNLRSIQD